ncbi:MAG: beta-ketoacyl-ACP synthase II [Proteobacteria bacterium]|nr:beta-ketoacyl-ACP synthase II [Pseudomonadota bacterium]
MKDASRRVVVTGLGAITPLADGVVPSWQRLLAGEHGLSPLTDLYSEHYRAKVAGIVKDFDTSVLPPKALRRMDRFVQFACVASREALYDSGVLEDVSADDYCDFGVSIGVGMGGVDHLYRTSLVYQQKGPLRVSPFLIPQIIPNMASGMVAYLHGLKGPNICTTTACSSGSHGIGEAYMLIKQGLADRMLAGGSESVITPVALASFGNMKALSAQEDPRLASRPFDAERDGFVIGEGAGVLLLERLDLAQKRQGKIYAEIIGYGMSGDAYHMTAPAPQGQGARRCMNKALELSSIAPEQVDYINAHGTSTPLNDAYETQAIKDVFSDHAYKLAISSTKGATGHLLGGAGGVEGCFSVLTLYHQIAPPTIHWKNKDPLCDLDYVQDGARQIDAKVVMSNSFGFGGANATLVFKHYESSI